MSRAFLFPGQGAQYPGMGKDFCEAFVAARAVFEEADDILSQHFSKLIFEGPAQELTLTKNSQLAIYITSIAILRSIEGQLPQLKPSVCAGHSLGEYTALTAAQKISFRECLPLVQARAQYMHEACVAHPGTMRVIMGLSNEQVEEIVQSMRPLHEVWIACLNCPGQVVISGTEKSITEAAAQLLAKGAKRVLPMDVSGAFHSGLMEDARKSLEPFLLKASLQESSIALVMNVPGLVVSDPLLMRQYLMDQVTHPVKWEQSVQTMLQCDVKEFIEIGPGKILAGMNRRIGVSLPTTSIEKISDLEEIACHSF